MKKNKIQVVLPDALVEKFIKEAEKQNRSESNLARMYIVAGLKKDLDLDLDTNTVNKAS